MAWTYKPGHIIYKSGQLMATTTEAKAKKYAEWLLTKEWKNRRDAVIAAKGEDAADDRAISS